MTLARCDSIDQDRLGVAGQPAPSSVAASAERWSWGNTVTASAPAMPAAKQATVERSVFTHGS